LSDFLLKKKRILCVEDDEDTCELITFLLSDYTVLFTDSIKNATKMFETEHFDLYLLDNWLSDGIGVDLCRKIRTLKPNVPIMFASGVAQKDEIQRAINAGAQAYLVKPYLPEELQKIVKELIELNN
jgi:CheY-like chemotaxis protein